MDIGQGGWVTSWDSGQREGYWPCCVVYGLPVELVLLLLLLLLLRLRLRLTDGCRGAAPSCVRSGEDGIRDHIGGMVGALRLERLLLLWLWFVR